MKTKTDKKIVSACIASMMTVPTSILLFKIGFSIQYCWFLALALPAMVGMLMVNYVERHEV